MANVTDHADDGRAAVLRDLLSNRIAVRPELAREVLVDDDRPRTAGPVAIVEDRPARNGTRIASR